MFELMNSNDYIEIDYLLDTRNAKYVETFNVIDYEVLKELFGEPSKVYYCDEIDYEWKLLIKGRIYCIYNWIELDDKNTYHIASVDGKEDDINLIKKYIARREVEYVDEEIELYMKRDDSYMYLDEIINDYYISDSI